MPIVQADRLTRIAAALLKAAGASDEEASAVAIGCVNANLAGHDSHGVIAIPTYIDRIKAGHIVPGAKWTIVQESPTTTVIDGHWGFGFHVNAKAMAMTIEKAKTANVAACTVFRQSHVGRLDTKAKAGEQAAQYFHHRGKAAALVALAATERQQCAALAVFLRIGGVPSLRIDDPALGDCFATRDRERDLAGRHRRSRHIQIERCL